MLGPWASSSISGLPWEQHSNSLPGSPRKLFNPGAFPGASPPPPRKSPALRDCCRAEQVGKGLPPQPGSSCWRRTGEREPLWSGGGGDSSFSLPTSCPEKWAEGLVHLCNLEGDPTGMAKGIGHSEGSPSCLTPRGSPWLWGTSLSGGSLLHRVGGGGSSRCQLCLQNWCVEQWRAPLRQAGEAPAAAPAQVALPAPYPSTTMQGEGLLLPFLEGALGE